MKIFDILQQLYATVPDLTDKFSSSGVIASVSASNETTVTVVTTTAHGLETNAFANISGLYYQTPIESLGRFGTVISVETSTDNDLTKDFQEKVTLSGFNETEFNGEFDLVEVPNRTNFILTGKESDPDNGTGSGVLHEFTGINFQQINGVKSVTVIDDTTFTFEAEKAITVSHTGIGRVDNGYRMAGAINPESAVAQYTSQESDEYWLFVVLGDVVASKDRKNNSDSVYVFNAESGYKQQTVHELNIFVFATTSDSISARPIRDDMEDIAVVLIKSLCGKKVDNDGQGEYFSIVFSSHLTAFYDKATYVHVFSFESTGQINDDTIFKPNDSVAFRDVFLEQSIFIKNIG